MGSASQGLNREDRKWTVTVVLACVILSILLAALALVQYSWLADLRKAERQQMELSLKAAAGRFADDFVGELLRVVTAFQLEYGAPSQSLADQLSDAYEQWVGSAANPNLIRDLILVTADDFETRAARFDTNLRILQPLEWSDHLDPLIQQLMWHTSTSPQAARATNIKNPIFLEDVPALAVPFVVTSEKRNVPGWSVAWLDRNFIVENLLPKLFESHFAVSDPPPYRIAIVSAERPHRVIYQSEPFSGEDLSSADLMVDLLPEVDGKLKRIGPQAIHIIAPETPQWRLVVKHRLGSVDAAVENLRSRNLGIGLGILCVLAAAVGLVLVAASRARSLARAQLEFAAAVSHELRTPLAVIRAAAYNLEEGIAVDRPRVRYYASLIKDAGRRLSKMVDQVLLFAETQSKERRIEVRSVPVAEVIENALDSVAATIVCDQWKAEKFIEPDLPPVLADPVLLSHCLQNILNNALKYGKVTHITPVKIMATRDLKKPEVQISVSDEGPGIDASDLPHIFNPFYRGINVEPDMAGSGLGLALVRRLMSIQNGDVSVKTGEHGGCTFVLRIPADGMKK